MIYILDSDFTDNNILKSKLKNKIFKRNFDYFETRTCSEEEFNERFSDKEGIWSSMGANHTILKNGWIRRTHIQENWCIDISNNFDLINLVSEFGEIDTFFYKPYNYVPMLTLKERW